MPHQTIPCAHALGPLDSGSPPYLIPGSEAVVDVVVVDVVVVVVVVDVEVVGVGVVPNVAPLFLMGISSDFWSPPGAEDVSALLGGRGLGGGMHEKAN